MKETILIQHEDTGRTTEWPRGKPLPSHRWYETKAAAPEPPKPPHENAGESIVREEGELVLWRMPRKPGTTVKWAICERDGRYVDICHTKRAANDRFDLLIKSELVRDAAGILDLPQSP